MPAMGASTTRLPISTSPIVQASSSVRAVVATDLTVSCAAGAAPVGRRPRFSVAKGSTVAKEVILTREGFEKLKDEIEELSTVRRREVAERIKEAREFGDISENSEYDDAKNEQAMLEARIAQLEERLRDATVIEADDLSTDV